jgi:hypothetical protein
MMSWFEQVRHVFAKDVRSQRWLLAAFVAMLAIGAIQSLAVGRAGDLAQFAANTPVDNTMSRVTFEAAGPEGRVAEGDTPERLNIPAPTSYEVGSGDFAISLTPVGTSLADIVAPFIAVLMCGLIVLADHPTQPRTLWPTLPYTRSTIWGAKLLYTLAMVMLAAVTWAIPMLVLQLPVAEIPGQLLESMTAMVTLCVAALLLAAASRDLTGVVLLMVVLLISTLLGGVVFTLMDGELKVPVALFVIARPALIGTAAWWLYLLYRERPASRGARLASFGFAGLMFAPEALQLTTPVQDSPSLSQLIPGAQVSSRVETQRGIASDSSAHTWHVSSSGIPSNLRVEQQLTGLFELNPSSDCIPQELGIRIPSHRVLQFPLMPIDQSLRWPAGAPKKIDSLSFAEMAVPAGGRPIAATCVSRTLRAQFVFSEPVVFAEVPLRTGAQSTRNGQRVVIRDAAPNGSPHVASVLVQNVHKGALCGSGHPTFVLINRTLREAVLLKATSSGSYGARICGYRYVLTLASGAGRPIPWQAVGRASVDESAAWLRDAQLVIIEWQHRATAMVTPISD